MKPTLPCFLGLALLLSACGGQAANHTTPAVPTESVTTDSAATQPVTDTLFAMDTVMELTLYGSDVQLAAAEDTITQLEQALSVTLEDSQIYALNQTGSGTLTQHPAQLLEQALSLCAWTGDALDLSIYPVVRAWGFTTGDYRVPEEEELQALLSHVDYRQIKFDPDSGEVTLPAGMEIDLGSVAKGYTGDTILAQWQAEGVTSALLNLGGNVQALGSKPDGSPWRVAVQDPEGDGYLGVLEICGQAVITSGGYERYFQQDGETYWHIIDPATGAPARSGLLSVTIVGDSGVICDGLSTALFVMGLEEASAFWQQEGGFEAIFVTEDHTIHLTQGLESLFTPVDDTATLEVIPYA